MPANAFKDHKSEKKVVDIRTWTAIGCMVILTIGLIARFFYLQVICHHELSTQSDENRVHLRVLPPTRGLIYDTNGQLLASNRSSRALSIISERVKNIHDLLHKISQVIPLSQTEEQHYLRRAKRSRPFESVPLKFNLTDQETARIAVNQFRWQGVEINAELVSYYPEKSVFAHTVGYVGRINDRDLAKINQSRYNGTHSIGKIGIEKYYENILMGYPGYQEVETNAQGRALRVLQQKNSISGENLHLYLNSRLQKVAIAALHGRRGAVVAMDPNTGGILAMVSSPSFDPDLFVTGITTQEFAALNTDINHPLYNRASLGEYPPASTIKPFMALALLKHKIINPKDKIFDRGWFQLPGNSHRFRNWKRSGHGWVNLQRAIIISNDTYFYNQAEKLGINRLHSFIGQFGFGHKTGLDIGEERPGLLPSPEWKKRVYKKPWYLGETVIAMIGQGYMLATPLQLAEAVSLIANRGKHVEPRLVKDNTLLKETQPWGKDITIGDPKNWNIVIDAMEKVVSSRHGTAFWRIGRGLKYKIAGKTGTAQVVGIPQGEKYDAKKLKEFQRDHSLFIAFAPVAHPLMAIAVVIENDGGASNVARKVLDAYILPKLHAHYKNNKEHNK